MGTVARLVCLADDDAIPVIPRVPKPVLPALGRLDFRANFRLQFFVVFQTIQEFSTTFGEMSWMDEGVDPKPIVDIRIDVGSDLSTFRPRRFDPSDRELHITPVLATGRFEMKNVNRSLGDLTDFKSFIDRLEKPVAFV